MNKIDRGDTPVMEFTTFFLKEDDPIPAYRGNPLIGALCEIPTDQERVGKLLKMPTYDPSVKELPSYLRAHAIKFLPDIFFPTVAHDRAMQEIDIMLRRGYVNRNPLCPAYRRQILGDMKLLRSGSSLPERHMNLLGAALIGPPGTGKTTTVLKTICQYPLVVEHCYEVDGIRIAFKQVPALYMTLYHDASLKAFAAEFFNQLAVASGDDDVRNRVNGLNANTAQPIIYAAAREYNLGLLVVDDSQNMSSHNHGYKHVLNYFVRLMNCVGVPVVLIGTDHTEEFLRSDLTVSRRFVSSIPRFAPFQPKRSGEKNGLWEQFLECVFRYQFVRSCSDYQNLGPIIYELTGGIPDLVIKLFTLTQSKLFGNKVEEINETALRETASELFSTVHNQVGELRDKEARRAKKQNTEERIKRNFEDRMSAELQRVGASPTDTLVNVALQSDLSAKPPLLETYATTENDPSLGDKGTENIDRPHLLKSVGVSNNIRAELARLGVLEKI